MRDQAGRPLVLGGRRYRVRGYISNVLPNSLRHEPHLLPALERALRLRPGLFLDVGANLGQTLLKVLHLDPARPYLAVEPQVSACFFLSRFISDNRLDTVRLLPIGLSDADGLVNLYVGGEADEMASLTPGTTALATQVIQVRIGDDVLAELGAEPPGIIKIDVEGVEVSVLRGLERTLRTAQPILFFEVLPNFAGAERRPVAPDVRERQTANAAALWELLADLGYGVRQGQASGEERELDRFMLDDPARFEGSDYVAYPR